MAERSALKGLFRPVGAPRGAPGYPFWCIFGSLPRLIDATRLIDLIDAHREPPLINLYALPLPKYTFSDGSIKGVSGPVMSERGV